MLPRHSPEARTRGTGLVVKIALIAALLLLVVFAAFPPGIEFLHVLQKTAHPLTFAAVCLLILRVMRDRTGLAGNWQREYAAAFAVTVGLGAVTEIAQIFTHRDPAVTDVLRDAIGAATGLALDAWLAHRGSRRIVAGLLGFGGLLAILAPLAWCVAAYANRDLKFPVLAEFNAPLDMYFIGHNDHGLRRVPVPRAWVRAGGESVLEVPLGREPWPGVALEEPYPDWRGKSAFAIDITNPDRTEAAVTVRVNDRQHDQEFADRFNREFILPPQSRTVVRIPLADIESAPAGRRMDMSRIAHVGIFISRQPAPTQFLLNRLWLE